MLSFHLSTACLPAIRKRMTSAFQQRRNYILYVCAHLVTIFINNNCACVRACVYLGRKTVVNRMRLTVYYIIRHGRSDVRKKKKKLHICIITYRLCWFIFLLLIISIWIGLVSLEHKQRDGRRDGRCEGKFRRVRSRRRRRTRWTRQRGRAEKIERDRESEKKRKKWLAADITEPPQV